MSLVKFTELPSGSIQGGDVLAVAGVSSYKVTAVEYANWSNKRIQGNTDKTIEQAYKFAQSNADYIGFTITPQLGQIGTNKTDIAASTVKIDYNKAAIDSGVVEISTNRQLALANQAAIALGLTVSYDNQPSIIATLIENNNFIKNPAAQHIGLYWKRETGVDATGIMLGDLQARNLEYPGWSRAAGGLITYNFTVALDGMLTIGQLDGTKPEDLEYRINGGAWNKVGNGGIKSIRIGYAHNSGGAQISVRMHKDSGGIAFAIPSPAYWTTTAGVRDPNIRLALEKLTYGLRRKRIDLEACGYWFANLINKWNDSYPIPKPIQLGDISGFTIWEFNVNDSPSPTAVPWDNDARKRVVLARDGSKDYKYLFATSDPDLYTQAEVYN